MKLGFCHFHPYLQQQQTEFDQTSLREKNLEGENARENGVSLFFLRIFQPMQEKEAI